MYKILLCWRYLCTRYIALASIISVMLGVATMVVVNSVMAGFSREMRARIQGILSDVVVESPSHDGIYDYERHRRMIMATAGQYIEGMTPTVHIPAMLSYRYGGQWITRPVQVIGIDVSTKDSAGDFARYLNHAENRRHPSFELRDEGYDLFDHQTPDSPKREELAASGRAYRRWKLARERAFEQERDLGPQNHLQAPQSIDFPEESSPAGADQPILDPAHNKDLRRLSPGTATLEGGIETEPSGPAPQPCGPEDEPDSSLAEGPAGPVPDPRLSGVPQHAQPAKTENPFAGRPETGPPKDPYAQNSGIVIGYAIASYRGGDDRDHYLLLPGDDVKLTLPTAGTPPRAIDDTFTVVDLYESKMNEYDSSFVFVPMEKLQQLRGMIDPQTGIGNFNSIQIKLKPGVDAAMVRDKLRAAFPPGVYGIYTWMDKQGPLLAAVQMETAILNVLLFLIIAVAGFGILAIFFTIVVEKTRDIGILKSLGASGTGIMGIFLSYGLSLGLVGSGVGMVIGLLFVAYINEIADVLSWLTGHEVFDPTIYYFYKIPTQVEPLTVTWIVLGAMAIAVLASVLPSRRAARLHPVEALRYE